MDQGKIITISVFYCTKLDLSDSLASPLPLADFDLASAAEDPALDLPLAEEADLPLEAPEGFFLVFFLLPPSSLSELELSLSELSLSELSLSELSLSELLGDNSIGLKNIAPKTNQNPIEIDTGMNY